jgi:hypothetical protein
VEGQKKKNLAFGEELNNSLGREKKRMYNRIFEGEKKNVWTCFCVS